MTPLGPPLVYFEYAYEAAARITSVRREGGNVVYYGYDLVNRLASEEWHDSGMVPLYCFQWDYDAVGNPTYEKRGDAETYYTYDAGNELLHTVSDGAYGYYHYDPRTNCTAIQRRKPLPEQGLMALEALFGKSNGYTATSGPASARSRSSRWQS